ncbi:MAG TPA: phosphohistidine phosphatase SixA [Oceanospirillaceae bacterium]|nr:phosphohistidine phosphatase SixA [Oceanospirillaceae bacterium]
MKLLLVRHGEASFNASTDAQRPLTQQGIRAVGQQVANPAIPWADFSALWASPYLRAQQTAQLIQTHLQERELALELQTHRAITPHGQLTQVQEFLLAQPQAGIILVTHQPLVSGLIGHFCHADAYLGEPMMPASMALLEGELAAAACMTLTQLEHP